MNHRYSFAALTIVLLLNIAPAIGEDHFLTIGGGYSPTGNQISLEKNVLMFRSMVNESYGADVVHDVLFADGDHPGRDIQFQDPNFKIPPAQLLLAEVNRQTRYLNLQYRSNEIENVRAGTSKENIEKWFKEVGAKLDDGDRLFIYVTAHGGKSTDKKQPFNTGLYLWNNKRLPMVDFATMLDTVPDNVPVVVVMVQCYSGGFADIIFEKGQAKNGMSSHNRCGFFATVHNRVAAGCTPDINEANYQEYSSYFFSALRGVSRAGEPITDCDYDQDQRVSFEEAHAYALLESNTIDISVKTSDAFLREHSRTKPDSKKGDDDRELTTLDADYEKILESASPAQRAVLEGLSTQLNLAKPKRAAEARERASAIAKQKKEIDGKKRKKDAEYAGLCRSVLGTLRTKWPELANRWHPQVDKLLRENADELVKTANAHPNFTKLKTVRAEIAKLSKQKMDLDRDWVKTQRIVRTLENVVSAANLPQIADESVVKDFERLRAAERQFFGVKGK
jgi:hypothetical protein